MPKNNVLLNTTNILPSWVTIREAVDIANKNANIKIKDGDIYRHALDGNIYLSIYFQSSVVLKKVKLSGCKINLRTVEKSLASRLCFLEKNCFINQRDLIVSTEGECIVPKQSIIDTTLNGHEYFLIQRLLAHSLGIPLPLKGEKTVNYGISVNFSGDIFQVFEKVTWQERIKKQIMKIPDGIVQEISDQEINKYREKDYFPIHDLPADACFVIRYSEIEKLINTSPGEEISSPTPNRISTPLSRLFWLACKHNDAISPLIRKPYKLLSIFEQWASTDGITDHLSGDTLKSALERGSPTSVSTSNEVHTHRAN